MTDLTSKTLHPEERDCLERDQSEHGTGMMSLPAEIVASIFEFVCYLAHPLRDSRRPHLYSTRPVTSALGLASVERRWRDITLSTSALWGQIAIRPRTSPELLALLFERSKSHPLEVMLDVRYGPLEPALLTMCEGVASRCRLLTVEFSDPDLFAMLFDRLASPNLEAILVWPYGMFATSLAYGLPAENAPSLASIYVGASIDIDSINCARLATLDVFCSGQEVFQIIEVCTNLKRASLHIEGDVWLETPSQIVAPWMVELELEFWGDHNWVSLITTLHCLSAPVLDSLNITPSDQSESFSLASFISTMDANPPSGLISANNAMFDFRHRSRRTSGDYSHYTTAMVHIASKFNRLRSLGIRHISISSLRLAFQAHTLAMPLVQTLVLHQSEGLRGEDWTLLGSPEDIATILELRRANEGVADLTTLILDGRCESLHRVGGIRHRVEGTGCRVVFVIMGDPFT